jgi:hypothetical protein
MAEPINHDTGSGVLTAAGSAAKWGIVGVIAAGVLSAGAAVVGIGLLGGFLGTLGATFGSPFLAQASFMGGATAMLTGLPAWGTALLGVAGALTYGTTGALVGGLFGLAKGGSRVSAEKAAYNERAYSQSQSRQQDLTQKVTDAEIAGTQKGYMLGAQDAEARIASQLQSMQQTDQTVATTPGAVAMASAEAKCECGPHTKAVLDQRQATAAAGITNAV